MEILVAILVFLLIAGLLSLAFYYHVQNDKQKQNLKTEYVNVLVEYRRTPDDNDEIKNRVVALGKKLIKYFPGGYTKESLLKHLHEATCLHNEVKYKQALTLLQQTPSNQTFRNKVRDLGKWLAQNYSEKYSEQSLTNDLMVCLSGHGDGSGGGSSVAAEIQKLGVLYSKGLITQEEFERGKALFLGSPPDKAKKTLESLGSLYRLMKQGVLTEAEFNMKKWDLLSGKSIK